MLKFYQGEDNIYFVGGYTNGIGLHENCLNQSLKIAEAIQKDILLPIDNCPLLFSN